MESQRNSKVHLIFSISALSIIAGGAILRLYQYASGRSLWIDEAALALNIVNKSFLDLTKPLDFNQGAPIGFLIFEKISLLLLGNSDYALRLFPLISGIVSIFIFYTFSKKILSRPTTLIVLFLFCVCPKLIYFSSEVKQYSIDVMCVLLILLTAQKCYEKSSAKRDFIVFGVTGFLVLWFSHPAFFILAGTGLTLAIDLGKKNQQRYYWAITIFTFWAINFILLYSISFRSLASNSVFISYWKSHFMPFPPWSDFGWFAHLFSGIIFLIFDNTDQYLIIICLTLIVIGTLFSKKTFWQTHISILLSIFTMFLASSLNKYPLDGRLVLFTIPIALILIGNGIDRVFNAINRISDKLSYCFILPLSIFLVFQPTRVSVNTLKRPYVIEHIKPVLQHLSENATSGDTIYVFCGARYAFQYYAPFYNLSGGSIVNGVCARSEPQEYIADIEKVKHKGRVWFIFTHHKGILRKFKMSEHDFYIDHLNKIGSNISRFKAPGCLLYLFDFNSQPEV